MSNQLRPQSGPQAGNMMNENSDKYYRLLVQSVVDYAIYMIHPDGTIANWNVGAERVTGYLPEEIIGKNIAVFYSESERAKGVALKTLPSPSATAVLKWKAGVTARRQRLLGAGSDRRDL